MVAPEYPAPIMGHPSTQHVESQARKTRPSTSLQRQHKTNETKRNGVIPPW